MQSIKNHLSLVIALLSIIFSIQSFIIVERSIDAYKKNLADNYSVIIVSKKKLADEKILSINKMIASAKELTPDSVINRLNKNLDAKNIELLKLSLPRFYKIKLSYYPSPSEIKKLTKDLLKQREITKVEDFSLSHDTTYKLLLLFKGVISIFAIIILVVTILLIFKELRIWQFKHNERMSVMGLFGAATWLRSAVLFRLAIVDAFISSAIAFGVFTYMASDINVMSHFQNLDINIVIFDPINDFLVFLGVSVLVSIVLASLIVIGHKEEV